MPDSCVRSVNICLMGAVEFFYGGKRVTGFRSQKTMALLAYLILERQTVFRNQLATLFWPEISTSEALSNLRRELYNIEKHLPGLLSKDKLQVSLALTTNLTVDVYQFQELSASEQLGDMETAVSLYRGSFLKGLRFEQSPELEAWANVQSNRLRRIYLEVQQQIIQQYTNLRDYAKAINHAEELVQVEPLEEKYHRLLITLFMRNNQLGQALRQIEACQQILAEELSLEPSLETNQLKAKVLRMRAYPQHNLPSILNPIVGRQKELAQLKEWLSPPSEDRLITLTGLGGIGKTHLALKLAHEMLTGQFLDGVFFVSFDENFIANNISYTAFWLHLANALNINVEQEVDPSHRILTYLQDKEVLLILDNVESILIAKKVNFEKEIIRLLSVTSEVALLITSRHPLNLQAERLFPLQSLAYPTGKQSFRSSRHDESFPSITLFWQIAEQKSPGISLEEDWHIIAEICTLLCGLPLAIYLTAPLVQFQSSANILQSLRKTLDTANAWSQDMPDRHKSIRASFDYSWQNLSEELRNVLVCLALFKGSFTFDAGRIVAQAQKAQLNQLIEVSLLYEDKFRFHLHPLVREYISEILDKHPQKKQQLLKKFSKYYLKLLEDERENIAWRQRARSKRLLAPDLANIYFAWDLALKMETQLSLDQLNSFSYLLIALGLYAEGKSFFEYALKVVSNNADMVTNANDMSLLLLNLKELFFHFQITTDSNLLTQAFGLLQNFISKYKHESDILLTNDSMLIEVYGDINFDLGCMLLDLGRAEEAKKYIANSIAAYDAISTWQKLAKSYQIAGNIAWIDLDWEQLEASSKKMLKYSQIAEDSSTEATALFYIGGKYGNDGDNETAGYYFALARNKFEFEGRPHEEAGFLGNMAQYEFDCGHFDLALNYVEQSLARYYEAKLYPGMSWCYTIQGRTNMAIGRFLVAERLLKQGMELRKQHYPALLIDSYNELARLFRLVDEDQADYYSYQAIILAERLNYNAYVVSAFIQRGHVLVNLKRYKEAHQCFERALAFNGLNEKIHLPIIWGKARISFAWKDFGRLVTSIEKISNTLLHLKPINFFIFRQPFDMLWDCYQLLRPIDKKNADKILSKTKTTLSNIANTLADVNVQRDFVNRHPIHSLILGAKED